MIRKVRERADHFLYGGNSFRREVRRQLRLLIVVTLGFTIAFTWRQTIFDVFYTFVQYVSSARSDAVVSFLTSTAITLVSLGFILVASWFLRDSNGKY